MTHSIVKHDSYVKQCHNLNLPQLCDRCAVSTAVCGFVIVVFPACCGSHYDDHRFKEMLLQFPLYGS